MIHTLKYVRQIDRQTEIQNCTLSHLLHDFLPNKIHRHKILIQVEAILLDKNMRRKIVAWYEDLNLAAV